MIIPPNNRWRSLRLLLPALLLLFAIGGALLLYVFELRNRAAEFEADFRAEHVLLAARIQADVERWVQRNDLETVQSILADLGVTVELKAALLLDPADTVLAAMHREAIGRPLDIGHVGLDRLDAGQLRAAMLAARQNLRGSSVFTGDRNGLVACFPASLPPRPGELGLRRGGLLLVGYDLHPAKATTLRQLRTTYLFYCAVILLSAAALGVSLHFLITRRLERLKSAMTDFAQRKAFTLSPSKLGDEISHLVNQFNEMGTTLGKSMAEIQDLYDHAPCGYHSLDAAGTFVRINDTELSWLGFAREEVLGKMKFADLLTPPSLESFRRTFPGFMERGWVHDLEFELVRKDGTLLPVTLNATAIKDTQGNFVMSRSVVLDATERKRAEAAVRQLNAELEQRVAARTRQLQEANQELVEFSYSVSHDLRTPLRSIDGFSHALLEDYATALDDDGKDYLQRVRAASQRMGLILDAMVRLLRLNRTDMHVTDVDLSELAAQVAGALQKTDPDREAEFIIAPGCASRGDPGLLQIALENLLDNAWKFTAGQHPAKIEFGATGTPEGPACFVRDNGAGFDRAAAPKLFGAFQRFHTAEEFPGTGIGLATVQRIIHRHGGRVWAESQPGHGATFYFTLPTEPTKP
jgi:PAS domain S-box-containing protein